MATQQVISPNPQQSALTAGHLTSSLYVGDLQQDVTEAMLFELFSRAGPVSSIRVCRDSITRRSLGYAYVNFHNVVDAERALDTLNFQPINGVPCRIMWSHRDPSIRRNNNGNLFVKNLHSDIDNKALYDIFSPYGSILSCKVAMDAELKSKGFGFVQFAKEENATKAIEEVNDKDINGLKVYVGKFERRQERTGARFTNIYVKGIPKSWDDKRFEKEFKKFGKITSASLPKVSEGSKEHKGFGFVNYETHEEALKATEEGKKISISKDLAKEAKEKKEPVSDEKKEEFLFVDRFQKKAERKQYLERLAFNARREIAEKSKNSNLYVKHLDDDVDDEKLREMFAEFGNITSSTVMKNEKGNSKNFGFVCFESEADAEKALAGIKGKPFTKKPLFVARAQRKEERRAQLEIEFQTNMVTRMQYSQLFYPPNAIPMAQPGMFYPPMFRRYPPNAISMQMRGGYPQVPVMNSYLYQQKRGRGGYFTQPRGGAPQNRGNPRSRINQPRNHQPPATAAPIMPQSVQQGKDLASILAQETSLERQKNILGERLFPLIQKDHGELAGKITGMLLEMDVSEILNLIESSADRQAKINEALEVLNSHK